MKLYGLVLLIASAEMYGQVVNPPSGGGGGGATIPSTTNLIKGDGAGNGADSGIVPANVATLSGTQTLTGAKTFSASTVVNSTTATSASAPTLTVTDSETSQASMVGQTILAPNMSTSSILYNYFGHDTGTRNSAYMGFAYKGAGSTLANWQFSFAGTGSLLTLFATNDVTVGSATDSGFKLDVIGSFRATTYNTATNCASAASPAVCGSAASGGVAVPLGANQTLVVNTTAVTANSQIHITEDESLGTRLGITCDTTLPTGAPIVTARTAGTSFTIQVPFTTTNQACISYTVVN